MIFAVLVAQYPLPPWGRVVVLTPRPLQHRLVHVQETGARCHDNQVFCQGSFNSDLNRMKRNIPLALLQLARVYDFRYNYDDY